MVDLVSQWVPQVWGSGQKPQGQYQFDGMYWLKPIDSDWYECTGWAVVRLNGHRGSGMYRFDLPFEPVVHSGLDEWYRLGSGTLGFDDWTHRSATSLHRNGDTTYPSSGNGMKSAVMTEDSILFVYDGAPKGGNEIHNFHWNFNYLVPASDVEPGATP